MTLEILIVEDERVSRAKLLAILEPYGHCTAVTSGEAAMAAIQTQWKQKRHFDVVTLDVHLTGIDGRETLKQIRQWENKSGIAGYQQAKVIMMTSTADVGMVSTCRHSGCNDYIVKPFNPSIIQQKMDKLGFPKQQAESQSGKEPIEIEILRRLKSNRIFIPPLPQIAFHLRELLDKGADTETVIEMLSQDVALSARVIGVSNTALYRGVEKNRTIRQAVSWLGMRTTQQIVESVCNHSIYGIGRVKTDQLLQRMWEHALATAHAAALIESMLGTKSPEDLFTMGMLHDIGRPVLLPVLVDMDKTGWFNGRINSTEIENLIEKWHASIGAAILEQWGYSQSFIDIVRFHETSEKSMPASDFFQELLIIRCADQLSLSAGFQPGNYPLKEKLNLVNTVRRLGLDASQVQSLMLQLKEKMEKIKGAFH